LEELPKHLKEKPDDIKCLMALVKALYIAKKDAKVY